MVKKNNKEIEGRLLVLEACVKDITNRLGNLEIPVDQNQTKIASLETLLTNARDDIRSIKDNHLPSIQHEIKDIREKLLGRPSWSVMIVLTFLSSLSLGLITYVLTHH